MKERQAKFETLTLNEATQQIMVENPIERLKEHECRIALVEVHKHVKERQANLETLAVDHAHLYEDLSQRHADLQMFTLNQAKERKLFESEIEKKQKLLESAVETLQHRSLSASGGEASSSHATTLQHKQGQGLRDNLITFLAKFFLDEWTRYVNSILRRKIDSANTGNVIYEKARQLSQKYCQKKDRQLVKPNVTKIPDDE